MSAPANSRSAIDRFRRALDLAGVTTTIRELPHSTRTAAEAAVALGCRVEQIAKSLVFRRADDLPVLVVAGGGHRVDESLVGRRIGIGIAKADASFVRATTGFAIGGVPPLGHLTPIQTLVDRDLLAHEVIWAAAGTPHAVVSLHPPDLVAATDATVLAICGDGDGVSP